MPLLAGFFALIFIATFTVGIPAYVAHRFCRAMLASRQRPAWYIIFLAMDLNLTEYAATSNSRTPCPRASMFLG